MEVREWRLWNGGYGMEVVEWRLWDGGERMEVGPNIRVRVEFEMMARVRVQVRLRLRVPNGAWVTVEAKEKIGFRTWIQVSNLWILPQPQPPSPNLNRYPNQTPHRYSN